MKESTHLKRISPAPDKTSGFVATPICRGSTAIYQSLAQMRASAADTSKRVEPRYGRFGNPTTQALEDEITRMENGFATTAVCSGLAASTTAIGAFVAAGDHILVCEGVYQPVRRYCESLKKFQVDVEYYDPCIGDQISTLIQPHTKLIYLESPSSLLFEVQDVKAIAQAAKSHPGLTTIIDNTWATPLFFQPLDLEIDVCIHSATKYIAGHSDSFLGAIVCNERSDSAVRAEAIRLGHCVSADDASLCLRGLRTLAVRLKQHESSALELMDILELHPAVRQVLHPSRVNHPGHAIWTRDFRGGAGVFSIVLDPYLSQSAIERFIEDREHFAIGHSWGGFESLIIPADLGLRERPSWLAEGELIRLQIGLESITDLRDDLTNGLDRLLDSK